MRFFLLCRLWLLWWHGWPAETIPVGDALRSSCVAVGVGGVALTSFLSALCGFETGQNRRQPGYFIAGQRTCEPSVPMLTKAVGRAEWLSDQGQGCPPRKEKMRTANIQITENKDGTHRLLVNGHDLSMAADRVELIIDANSNQRAYANIYVPFGADVSLPVDLKIYVEEIWNTAEASVTVSGGKA